MGFNGFSMDGELWTPSFVLTFEIGAGSDGALTAACPTEFFTSVDLLFMDIGLLLSVNRFLSSAESIVRSSDENCVNGSLSVSLVKRDDIKFGFGTDGRLVLGCPESNLVLAWISTGIPLHGYLNAT